MFSIFTRLFLNSHSSKSPRPRMAATRAINRRNTLKVEELESRQMLSAVTAPSFTLTPVSGSQINIAWTGTSGASGYVVDEWVNGAWRQIDRVAAGTTLVDIVGLTPGTLYYFDVAAYNASGTSWANFRSASTPKVIAVDHPAASSAYSPVVNGTLFGTNGPSYLDVRQGGVGDCWLMASLAEVAAREPAVIRNMFTYEGTNYEDGSIVDLYWVRLYDNSGVARYITVDTELPAAGNTYDHPNGIMWVALAEKAYAQANGAKYVTTQAVGSDSYSALNGGYATWALHAITGKTASNFSINPTNIAAAWNAGELIVLSSSSHPGSQYIVGGADGTHAYAVVGYNPSSSLPFEVYNPWGTNASGWALSTYHGHQVYGLFNANGAFLSASFTTQSVGLGATGVKVGSVKDVDPVQPGVDNFPRFGFVHDNSPSQASLDAYWANAGSLETPDNVLGEAWFANSSLWV